MLNVLILAPHEKGGPTGPLARALKEAGYAVARTALDGGAEALCRAFGGRPPDALLADLTRAPDFLPLRHAQRLLRDAWGDDVPTPTRLALFETRHLALPDWPAHADDFLLPPYAPDEMLARLALLSFRRRHVRSADTLHLGDVTLDLAGARALDEAGNILPLTPREYELLRFLALHRGKFFARDRLLDMVWGVDFEGGERTVDIHMRRLRAKLPPQAAARLETRRGLGYGLAP
ncbi:MAG: response regulator transcription factor [Armatimonadetes bacterium]|nr:response regulator transcription factor [Armatimonadota bacterium]